MLWPRYGGGSDSNSRDRSQPPLSPREELGQPPPVLQHRAYQAGQTNSPRTTPSHHRTLSGVQPGYEIEQDELGDTMLLQQTRQAPNMRQQAAPAEIHLANKMRGANAEIEQLRRALAESEKARAAQDRRMEAHTASHRSYQQIRKVAERLAAVLAAKDEELEYCNRQLVRHQASVAVLQARLGQNGLSANLAPVTVSEAHAQSQALAAVGEKPTLPSVIASQHPGGAAAIVAAMAERETVRDSEPQQGAQVTNGGDTLYRTADGVYVSRDDVAHARTVARALQAASQTGGPSGQALTSQTLTAAEAAAEAAAAAEDAAAMSLISERRRQEALQSYGGEELSSPFSTPHSTAVLARSGASPFFSVGRSNDQAGSS